MLLLKSWNIKDISELNINLEEEVQWERALYYNNNAEQEINKGKEREIVVYSSSSSSNNSAYNTNINSEDAGDEIEEDLFL
jgi:hypothetical protein